MEEAKSCQGNPEEMKIVTRYQEWELQELSMLLAQG